MQTPTHPAPVRRRRRPACVIQLLLAVIASLSSCGSGDGGAPGRAPDAPLMVFAAASTTDAVSEIARAWQAVAHREARCNFASSSSLAKQIDAGAPFDMYLSANPQWMDYVERRHWLRAGSRRDLLGNTLVLIAPRGEAFPVEMAPSFALADAFPGRLAMGDPDHVPVGMYGKQALERLGWWTALRDRIAAAADVRSALRFVELGEARAGIVYRTDAAVSAKVEVVAAFPSDAAGPIVYPVALSARAGDGAESFLAYLRSPAAADVFTRAGFTVLPSGESPEER